MERGVAALCGVIAILLSGCSTIVKGTQQQVSVATPRRTRRHVHAVVSCRWHARRADTWNHRPAQEQTRRCSERRQAGYTTGVGVLASETEIMTAGNVLFGGVIGLGIDAASGAMNKYQPGVEIAMSPISNCGAPKKGRGAPMASTPVPPPEPPS